MRLAHRWSNFEPLYFQTKSARTLEMATYEKEGKDIQAEGEQEHKIRITITSKNCSAIERISNELVKAARDKNLKVKVCSIFICLKKGPE